MDNAKVYKGYMPLMSFRKVIRSAVMSGNNLVLSVSMSPLIKVRIPCLTLCRGRRLSLALCHYTLELWVRVEACQEALQ